MTTAALTDAEVDAAIERLRPSDPTRLARAIYRAGYALGIRRAPAVPREPLPPPPTPVDVQMWHAAIRDRHEDNRARAAMYDVAPKADDQTTSELLIGPKLGVARPAAPAQATELERRLRARPTRDARAALDEAADAIASLRAEQASAEIDRRRYTAKAQAWIESNRTLRERAERAEADVARLTRELFDANDEDARTIARQDMAINSAHARADQLAAALRCTVTKNPCGTDTWAANSSCQCVPCQAYLADRAALAQEDGNGQA